MVKRDVIVKLKTILVEEVFPNDEVKVLYEELKSGDYLLTKKRLYRGMTTHVNTFIYRSTRKGRVPKATTKTADTFVNELLEEYFPSHPVRRKATFGTPDKAFAGSFGKEKNLLIPNKSAKVKFYEDDSWPKYTSNIGNTISHGTRELNNLRADLQENERLGDKFLEWREEFDEDVVDFIYGIWELKNYSDAGIFSEVLDQFPRFINLYSDLQNFTQNEKVKEELRGQALAAANYYKKALNKFKEYVSDGHDQYHPNTREVIVEGDHIIVNPFWFNKFFQWNNGNVKLKSEDK